MRHSEGNRPAASIDDRRSAHDFGAGLSRNIHRLARRFPGGEHIFHYEHSLAWGQMESAPQTQRRAARPFGENRAHAERPSDFVTNDQSTERR